MSPVRNQPSCATPGQGLGLTPVLLHHGDAAHPDFAGLAVAGSVAVKADDTHLGQPGDRPELRGLPSEKTARDRAHGAVGLGQAEADPRHRVGNSPSTWTISRQPARQNLHRPACGCSKAGSKPGMYHQLLHRWCALNWVIFSSWIAQRLRCVPAVHEHQATPVTQGGQRLRMQAADVEQRHHRPAWSAPGRLPSSAATAAGDVMPDKAPMKSMFDRPADRALRRLHHLGRAEPR